MSFLKQNTAVNVLVGPFLDDTDGTTVETGLTIAQSDILLSKNGGPQVQKNDSSSATHDAGGYYIVSLNTTDTNTLGVLTIQINVSGALYVQKTLHVLASNIYDSLFGSDKIQTDVTQVSGSSVSSINDFHADVLTALTTYDPPTKAEMDLAFAALENISVADLLSAVISSYTGAGTFGLALNRIDNTITSRASQSSIDGLNDISSAQVNAEVVDVLNNDATTEPTSVPSEIAPLSSKINFLFAKETNKITQTNTTQTVRNASDTNTIATSSITDTGTTTTRGQYT